MTFVEGFSLGFWGTIGYAMAQVALVLSVIGFIGLICLVYAVVKR